MPLVDLPTALAHLRVDAGDEDALVTLYLGAAEASAVEFLNRSVYVDQAALEAANEPAEALPMVVNAAVQAAILLILGHLYANREEVAPGTMTKVPFGAHTLLQPYRIGLGV